jgi:hypothetical protein
MIRQTINCDICAAEKQSTSYWFVAYEQSGEITLRGWEAPRTSRKHAKHLCGQKCVQRMMSNFTASVMASGHGEVGKESAAEAAEPVSHAVQVLQEMRAHEEAMAERAAGADRAAGTEHAAGAGRMVHIDPELVAAVEAESWAGPVKPKESLWDMPHKLKMERESFLHAARPKPAGTNRLQKMA